MRVKLFARPSPLISRHLAISHRQQLEKLRGPAARSLALRGRQPERAHRTVLDIKASAGRISHSLHSAGAPAKDWEAASVTPCLLLPAHVRSASEKVRKSLAQGPAGNVLVPTANSKSVQPRAGAMPPSLCVARRDFRERRGGLLSIRRGKNSPSS